MHELGNEAGIPIMAVRARSEWEEKFRERFERDMIEWNDTSFFLPHDAPARGWLNHHSDSIYPPKPRGPDLFAGV